eukprot:12730664-Alexandrium_andersonii.AAC.1
MIDEAASGSAFRTVAGKTLKGAKQTALTPGGEVQYWALLGRQWSRRARPAGRLRWCCGRPSPLKYRPCPCACPWSSCLSKWAVCAC